MRERRRGCDGPLERVHAYQHGIVLPHTVEQLNGSMHWPNCQWQVQLPSCHEATVPAQCLRLHAASRVPEEGVAMVATQGVAKRVNVTI